MGAMDIVPLRADLVPVWIAQRCLLWPNANPADLARESVELGADPDRYGVMVALQGAGGCAGFVEVSLRHHAEGCTSSPVGYIEAWYVSSAHRRAGLGRRLIRAAESWARERGCVEMASDTETVNLVSRAAHRAVGFETVEEVVLFRKRL
ncbi:MAG: Aminoglycoside N(6')-acetyltransferase type 1 [Phycisphaerales bacterium]|nr:Aminoglycoside N(6')-acetyltransferase type 1 [Phycisphaerales bacterium]